MDQAKVVTEQVVGGKKLLARLRGEGFAINGACWARTEDDGQWYLYLITPVVEGKDSRPSYLIIRNTLRQMDGDWADEFERIDPFDVKLIAPSDPLARGVLESYQRWPDEIPTCHGGSALGSVNIEGAYIYPARMFAPAQPQPAP